MRNYIFDEVVCNFFCYNRLWPISEKLNCNNVIISSRLLINFDVSVIEWIVQAVRVRHPSFLVKMMIIVMEGIIKVVLLP